MLHEKMNIQQSYCFSPAVPFSLWVTDADSMIYDGSSNTALFSGQKGMGHYDRTAGFPPTATHCTRQSHEPSQKFERREIQAFKTMSATYTKSS